MALYKYSSWTFGQVEALINTLGGDETARGILAGTVKVAIQAAPPQPTTLLLQPIGTVKVLATTVKFVAKEKFKLKKDGGICSYLGDNFTAWFLAGDGKIEDPFAGSDLGYSKLQRSARDLPQESGEEAIIPYLGGEAQAETTLTEMFSQMEKQKDGESGDLLTNGFANIFYIKDQNGVLRTVFVRWRVGGWDVYAFSVAFDFRWYDGSQVFSRKVLDLSATASA